MRLHALFAIPVLLPLALAACNGQEDFDDAAVGTPIISPPIQNPLDPTTAAVEIEFVAGVDDGSGARSAVVSGLGYRCDTVVFYIPAEGNTEGYEPNLARCPTSAKKVEFFIGQVATGRNNVSLGTFYLPVCSGRATTSDGTGSCFPGPGYYQATVADLVASPRRVDPANSDAYNRAALLAALDDDPGTGHVIEIAPEVHDIVNDQFALVPATRFADTDYSTFSTNWDPLLDEIAAQVGNGVLPATQAEAEAVATVAADRTRAGTLNMEHNRILYSTLDLPGALIISIPVLVYPDGAAAGVGLIGDLEDPDGATDVVALEGGSRLSGSLLLENGTDPEWDATAVLGGSAASLSFDGRILLNNVYDGYRASESGPIDYEIDFPLEDVPDLDSADEGDFTGSAYGATFNTPTPYKATRTGTVAGSLNDTVLGLLPEYYQLTLYKACTDGSSGGGCGPIPPDEIGVSYPDYVDLDASDSDPGYEVLQEQLRNQFYEAVLNVQILANGSIITDRDRNCSAVDTGTLVDGDGTQEYRVGFISRTEATTPSANMILFMAGPPALHDETATDFIPQYGTQIQGRIDLSQTSMPLYRLGDENFADSLRASWQDLYQSTRLDNSIASPTDEQRRELMIMSSGAVSGVRLDAGCTPVP